MTEKKNRTDGNLLQQRSSDASEETLKCGIVMPLSLIDGCSPAHWVDVQAVIREAVESLSSPAFKAEMVSQADGAGLIHRRIVSNLFTNDMVVCDVSCGNPNVMFELGMRLAFDKPVVIIKDDKTDYFFDTGPIEHLAYPRDLRYQTIQIFKRELAEKVSATFEKHKSNPVGSSYLKSFGPIEVAKLDTKEVEISHFLLQQMENLRSEIRTIGNAVVNRTYRNEARFQRSSNISSDLSDESLAMIANEVLPLVKDMVPSMVMSTPSEREIMRRRIGRVVADLMPERSSEFIDSIARLILPRMVPGTK